MGEATRDGSLGGQGTLLKTVLYLYVIGVIFDDSGKD